MVVQAVNYSFNFLLYCAVNVAFRRRFVELVSCRRQMDAETRLRLQLLTHSGGILVEASSGGGGDSVPGRRSHAVQLRTRSTAAANPACAAAAAVYRLTLSDPGE